MRVHVLFHDRCFDGMASAATFTRFYRERIDPSAEFTYRGLTHKAGTSFTPDVFTDAEVHVCVDFRYSASPKLTWWFDHHQSAFETPADEAHFRAHPSEKHFFDPTAQSCTKYLAGIAADRFGFDPKPIEELIHWADLIDGAAFPDARTAVALEHPALQLMLLVEGTTDPTLIPRLIQELSRRTLSDVVKEPWVQEPLVPLLERHRATIARVSERARFEKGVVFFDIADLGSDTFNKFIAYDLHPDATYTVVVSLGPKRAKISVGSNPWEKDKRRHNIAQICESYGGGGHPVVGAVSLPPDQLERAREIAAEIVATLQS